MAIHRAFTGMSKGAEIDFAIETESGQIIFKF